ncbi:hypothetical protein KKI23_02970, partial [Patescibacteria group bacterium]|nr:hypothetical protein [Patescibacteria group bacterium]
MALFSKIFGDPNKKELAKLQPLLDKINGLEKHFSGVSQENLRKKTAELQKTIKDKPEEIDNV